MEIIIILVGIIQGIIFGVATEKIIENKGYEENWFWWGFFFSFLAVIVAATKPSKKEQVVVIKSEEQHKEPACVVTQTLNSKIYGKRRDINSPVHIASWNIKKEEQELILNIEFMNVSEQIISAVLFSVVGYNSFSDRIVIDGKDEFEILEQDYNLCSGQIGKVRAVLLNSDIRKVDIYAKKICFSDGTIWEYNTSEWINTRQEPLEKKYIECVVRENNQGKYYSIFRDKYWQCVCGFVNTGEICSACGMRKNDASKYSKNQIKATHSQYLTDVENERKEQLEKQRIAEEKEKNKKREAEQKRRKNQKWCVRLGVICGIILLAVVVGPKIYNYICERNAVASYIEKEKYDSAFNKMIASDNYDILKRRFGDIVWEEERERDILFAEQGGVLYAVFESDLIYTERKEYNGICYYITDIDMYTDFDYDAYEEGSYNNGKAIYAVTKDGKKKLLLKVKTYCTDSYTNVDVEGVGKNMSDMNDGSFNNTICSNGWLLVTYKKVDPISSDNEGVYALKYDEKKNKTYKVRLSDEKPIKNYYYAKMTDGNIVYTDCGSWNKLHEDSDIKLFNVVTGNVEKISVKELEKKYNNNLDENIIFKIEVM